jgi:hypothetical protein
MDSHVDAVNYELFAATFAEDYVLSNTARSEAVYKDKKDLKVARAAKLTVIDDKSSDSAVAGESA